MSKAIAAKEAKHEVIPFDQSMFEQDAGAGVENLGKEDLALPFLKVLSRQDPTLDDLPDAKPGDIYNTVTGEAYSGKEGICVVPCAYQRRFIEWSPRGSGLAAPLNVFSPEDELPKTERSSEDNKDYVVGGEGSYLEETHQHFVVLLNSDGTTSTALVAMKSTQLKKSRKWNSMVAQRTIMGANGPFTPPRFSHIYRLKTLGEENSKGSWHGWEISLEKMIDDGMLYAQAKMFAESITKGEVEVKHQQEGSGNNDDNVPF